MYWKRKLIGSGRQIRRVIFFCLAAVVSVHAAGPDYTRAAIADDLAAQIREIVNTPLISRDKKERRITSTVRIAVVAATAYKDDRSEIVGIALQMAAAAVRAAPSFADVIARAVAFVPAVSRFSGAASEVRAATLMAARGRPPKRDLKSAGILVRKYQAPAPRPVASDEAPSEPVAQAAPETPALAEMQPGAPAPAEAAAPATTADNSESVQAAPSMAEGGDNELQSTAKPTSIRSKQPLIPLGDNGSMLLTADLGVRRDDNIFFSTSDKVAATIYSATPGIDFTYGNNSLAHALLDYQESFNRYSGGVAPNVNLASATGNVGYNDGSLKLGAGAQYQQLYQNNVGILDISGSELIRSNITDFNGQIESAIFSKLGAGISATYDRTSFPGTPGLYGNTLLYVPMNLYYAITPKVDLSAGYAFGQQTPEGNGAIAKSGFYNVGARGNFTQKFTGEFAVGYLTERVPGLEPLHNLGLTSNLTYEITPKTSASFQAARNFQTSAQGQVLKNGTYTLGVTSNITNQWEASFSVTYRTLDYGEELYSFESALVNQHRIDDYWEGKFQLAYVFTQWLNSSIYYVVRDDHSTLPGVNFGDNVLGLDVKFLY